MDAKNIQMLASVSGLIGSIILAFSLDRVLTETRLAINALATSIRTVVSQGDIYVFDGLDIRLEKASYISKWFVRAGIFFLVISTFLAAWSITLS